MRKLALGLVLSTAVLALVFFLPSLSPSPSPTEQYRDIPYDTPLGGTVVADTVVNADSIKVAQELYRARTGEYLKVMHNGLLPITEKGTVTEKLGVTVPDNVRIEIYKTPDGTDGYQICTETSTSTSCINVGGNARETWRTYVRPRPERATSTINMAPLGSLFSFAYPLAYAITTNTHSASTTRASSQYFSIDDSLQTGLDGGASMTFCVRMRLATYNTAGDHHTIVAKGSATGSTRQFRWNVRGDGGGGNTLWVFQASSAGTSFDGDTTVLDSGLLSPMTWYYPCVVFDGANTDTLYYRDGVQIGATQNNSIASIHNGTSPFSVGAENVGVSPVEFFNGQLDDLRVWTRVLSASEIAAIYVDMCTDSLNGSNLSAQWLFDNDALDYTVNNNDLTANGGATFSTDIPYDSSSCPPPPVPPTRTPSGTIIEGSANFNGNVFFH